MVFRVKSLLLMTKYFSLRSDGFDSYNELVRIIQDNWTESNVFNGNRRLAENHIILCISRIVFTRIFESEF